MPDTKLTEYEASYFRHVHATSKREPRWRGVCVVKYPTDLVLYAQVIFKRTPKFIIEAGTKYGGSALFFGDMITLTQGIKVFSIDIADRHPPAHPLVEYIIGSSTDPKVVDYIRGEIAKVPGASVMASLDSDHSAKHVLNELEAYKDIVTPEQYMVVEDSWTRRSWPNPPFYAVKKFLEDNPNYRKVDVEKQFIFSVARSGWLIRRQ